MFLIVSFSFVKFCRRRLSILLILFFQPSLAQPSLGSTMEYAALSCEDVANKVCNAQSDYYWIKSSTSASTALQYYCDMTMQGGAWLLLLERNTNATCPTGLMKDSATGFCKNGCTTVGCSAAVSTPTVSPFAFQEVRGQVRLNR